MCLGLCRSSLDAYFAQGAGGSPNKNGATAFM